MRGGYSSSYIRPTTRLAIYLRDGLACVYCGKDGIEHGLSLDHIIPRSRDDSTNKPTNLVTACWVCNRFLQNSTLQDLASKLGISLQEVQGRLTEQTSQPLTSWQRKRAQDVVRTRPGWYVQLLERSKKLPAEAKQLNAEIDAGFGF